MSDSKPIAPPASHAPAGLIATIVNTIAGFASRTPGYFTGLVLGVLVLVLGFLGWIVAIGGPDLVRDIAKPLVESSQDMAESSKHIVESVNRQNEILGAHARILADLDRRLQRIEQNTAEKSVNESAGGGE